MEQFGWALQIKVKSGRSYKNLKSIWNMVSRTAFEQLNHSLILLFICILGLTIVYLSSIGCHVHYFIFFSIGFTMNLHLVCS